MATLINCTFTAPNGTLLTAYPWTDPADINVLGAAWLSLSGGMQIVSNRAALVVDSGLRNHIASGVSDCIVSATGYTGQSVNADTVALEFRIVDVNNRWSVLFGLAGGVTRNLLLYEVTSGIATLRASAALAYTPNTAHTITVTLSGTSISITVVGASTATVNYTSASHIAATMHGIYLGQTGATVRSSFDNYKIETAGNAVPAIQHYYRRRRA